METFVYPTVNHASKYADITKIFTLGPYALALAICVAHAAKSRKDIDISRFASGIELYRGTGLTEPQIQKYRDLIVANKTMAIHGYLSTSLLRDLAESFAYNDPATHKKAVLYKINWKSAYYYFYMDMGSFKHEQEVLLFDGLEFEVVSVEAPDADDQDGTTLITLKYP